MPLISTNRPVILIEGAPWAVGFWMRIDKSGREDFVWVIATYECVADLDPTQLADAFNATDIAETHRKPLEQAASAKYDEHGVDPDEGEHEGKAVLRMHSYDLPG